MDLFFRRLELWKNLLRNGFLTTPEQPEPSRSDCHGWGSHPLYHFFTGILGIRPCKTGFSQAVIEPQLGSLSRAGGILPHPDGEISAEFRKTDSGLKGRISLPGRLQAKLILEGAEHSFQGTFQF